jgi:hypothetical protein
MYLPTNAGHTFYDCMVDNVSERGFKARECGSHLRSPLDDIIQEIIFSFDDIIYKIFFHLIIIYNIFLH